MRLRSGQQTFVVASVLLLLIWAGSPGSTNNAEPDFGPYMARTQSTIKKAWFPPKSDVSKHAVVIFKVSQDGSISNVKLQSSSGNATFDRAAVATLNKVRLEPLPHGSANDVDIQFTFEYNVKAAAAKSRGTRAQEDQSAGDFVNSLDNLKAAGWLLFFVVLGVQAVIALLVVIWLVTEKIKRDKKGAAT